jgi:fructokinase
MRRLVAWGGLNDPAIAFLDPDDGRGSGAMIQIGVDFGGTKIEAAALGAGGQVLVRQRVSTPATYEEAIAAVSALIAQVEQQAGAKGSVGVGCPGSISPHSGRMRNANTPYLNGRAFREDLEVAMGRPVRLANDANCLALSEAVDGAAAGLGTVFAVIVGTGCGGGLALDGRLVEGANGLAGEWGHTPLPWPSAEEAPGPACWCGRRGCLETWVSGTGLRRDHLARTGQALDGAAIIAAARAGDGQAQHSFDLCLDRLGRGLAVICDILDPDAFVFGGGLSNIAELYERLPGFIAPHVFSDSWRAKLVAAHWGDSSGVRGAARLWATAEAAFSAP